MNTCVITAATEDYLKRAEILYVSCKKYFLGIIFNITLINCSKNNFFEKLPKNNLKINYLNIKFIDNESKKNFASNIRCKLLYDNIKLYEKIYWFDADTIILKNINNLNNILNEKDILVYKNKIISYKKNKIILFKSGILGFKNNNFIIKFLEEWYNCTFKNGLNDCYWFQDQILLTELIIKYYNFIKICNLDKKYIDWDLNDESYIWVGKGDVKFNDKYLNKENSFMKNNK